MINCLSEYTIQDILLEIPNEVCKINILCKHIQNSIANHDVLRLLTQQDYQKLHAINVNKSMMYPQLVYICKITHDAIKENNLNCLKYVNTKLFPQNGVVGMLYEISMCGNIGMFDYILNLRTNFIIDNYLTLFMSVAIPNGHLEYIKYLSKYQNEIIDIPAWSNGLLSEDEPPSTDLCAIAAANGQLEILQYLHESGYGWNIGTCVHAAHYNHLSCLKYANEHKCVWDGRVYYVAMNNFDILKYLIENNCPFDGYCNARHADSLEILEYLHMHKFPHLEASYIYYAEHDKLDCIKFLFEHGYKIPFGACECAAKVNDKKCLKYLHTHGGKWDLRVCRIAAENNAFDCLKYAHKHGCKWDSSICNVAAANNNISCLQYAYENKCPCDRIACIDASKNGSLECLRYLIENNCPRDMDVLFYNSAHYGHLECLKYLMRISSEHNRSLIVKAVMSTPHRHILKYYDLNTVS
jgi:hypothetical protein